MTQQLTRDQVPPELTYDPSHIYATPADFEAVLVICTREIHSLR